jgi:hypothetical protein
MKIVLTTSEIKSALGLGGFNATIEVEGFINVADLRLPTSEPLKGFDTRLLPVITALAMAKRANMGRFADGPPYSYGYNKIAAIKELRDTFKHDDTRTSSIGLAEAKQFIEMLWENI